MNQGDQRKTDKWGDLKWTSKHGWFWVKEDKEEKLEQSYIKPDSEKHHSVSFGLPTQNTIGNLYHLFLHNVLSYHLLS